MIDLWRKEQFTHGPNFKWELNHHNPRFYSHQVQMRCSTLLQKVFNRFPFKWNAPDASQLPLAPGLLPNVSPPAPFKMAPLPPARCPPISLIGERVMLFVATQWVAAVYAVNHPTSDPPGPRFKWRDATTRTHHRYTPYRYAHTIVTHHIDTHHKDKHTK